MNVTLIDFGILLAYKKNIKRKIIFASVSLLALIFIFIGRQPLSDVSPLADCELLEWISLPQCPVSDISPLTALPRLRNLNLPDTNVVDVAFFAEMKALRFLHINTLELTDVSVLETYKLDHLRLEESPIQNLNGIEQFDRLEKLSLKWTNVTDFSLLNGLASLTSLEISPNMERYLNTLDRDDILIIVSSD